MRLLKTEDTGFWMSLRRRGKNWDWIAEVSE